MDAQKKRAVDSHSRMAEDFASYYRDVASDPYATCFTYGRMRLNEVLSSMLPANDAQHKLLDVGCGTGHHLADMRRRGFDVAGVDASEEMLAHARRNNPGADIRAGDVDQLPFDADTFDFVLCIEVLRYLPDQEQCIHEMRRVLKPGGRVLATAAPLLSLQGYAIVNRVTLTVPLRGFVRLRQFFSTSRSLRSQFAEAGFDDVRVHGVSWGPCSWVARLAPPLLRRFLRRWEPFDRLLADRQPFRELGNMFLVTAARRS